jgi:hypothetical protein
VGKEGVARVPVRRSFNGVYIEHSLRWQRRVNEQNGSRTKKRMSVLSTVRAIYIKEALVLDVTKVFLDV